MLNKIKLITLIIFVVAVWGLAIVGGVHIYDQTLATARAMQ